MSAAPLVLWTVGHSTRSLEAFLELLAAHRIEAIADVRRFPGSRKYPQFRAEALGGALTAAGIEYVPLPELGGRRHPRPDSPNTAWRNESFRGYADFMATEEFGRGIERLLAVARRKRTAVMCAEAVWWRCHRSMIADHLKAGGSEVRHLGSGAGETLHPYTSVARVKDGHLTYAPDE